MNVLQIIKERLQRVHLIYPIPSRISLRDTQAILAEFLAKRSGGLQMQAISVALFRRLGNRFELFDRVDSQRINAADAGAGKVADIEGVDATGDVVPAAEIKDRRLTLVEVQTKLPSIREKGITEFLFLIRGGIEIQDANVVSELLEREYRSGQNLYVCEFEHFLETCLVLFGEDGRRDLLEAVGKELDKYADLNDRETWRNLLEKI